MTASVQRLGENARRTRRRRWGGALAVVACGVTALAVIATATATTGCATHQCDATSRDYYDGFMLNADTFVTGNLDDPWLDYRGNATIRIWFPKEVEGRTPKLPVGAVGNDPTPNGGASFMGGGNLTTVSGQLAYYNFLNTNLQINSGHTVGGGFWATNGTCADYFARFEVDFLPVDAGAGAADGASAGASTDAGGRDAGEGAPDDGSTVDVPDAPSDG